MKDGPIRILHISDLHRAPDAPNSNEALLGNLAADIQFVYPADNGRLQPDEPRLGAPDLVVVSGDLTQRAKEEEFQAASEMLEQLLTLVDVDRRRVVIVPGNHDVDWAIAAQSYHPATEHDFNSQPPIGRPHNQLVKRSPDGTYLQKEESTYTDRFRPFKCFFDSFYHGVQTYSLERARMFTVYDLSESFGLVVAGFNSCDEIDACKSGGNLIRLDRRGFINDEAIYGAVSDPSFKAGEPGLLRIAVFHHHTRPIVHSDDFLDPRCLEILRQCGFHLCLHGHVHCLSKDKYPVFDPISSEGLKILGVGSLAVPYADRPQAPMGYNMLVFEPKSGAIWAHTRRSDEIHVVWRSDCQWNEGKPYIVVREPMQNVVIDHTFLQTSMRDLEEQKANDHGSSEVFRPMYRVPRQELFCGRTKIIEGISRHLVTREYRLVTLYSGVGGIGKSALAGKVAATISHSDFPDGIVMINLEEARRTETLVAKTAAALEMGLLSTQDMLVARMEKLRLLLVYDNVELVIANDLGGLRKYFVNLLQYTSVSILCTSREWIGLTDEKPIEVMPLKRGEARRLLRALLNLKGTRSPDSGYLEQLLDFCDGIPQIVETASCWFSRYSQDVYIAEFNRTKSWLLRNPKVGRKGTKTTNYQISFWMTYRRLGTPARQILKYICHLPAAPLQDMVIGVLSDEATGTASRQLGDWQLVRLENNCLRVLIPVREAVRHLTPKAGRDTLLHRLANDIIAYFIKAYEENARSVPALFASQQLNLTFALLTETDVVKESTASDLVPVGQLMLDFERFYTQTGLLSESQEILTRLLYVMELHDIPRPYRLYTFYGNILRLKDRYAEALASYSKALETRTLLAFERADVLFGLGNVYKTVQMYAEARSSFLESLKLYKDGGDVGPRQAACLWGLGNVDFATSRWSEGLGRYEEALELLDSFPNSISRSRGQIDCLKGICDVRLKQREYAKALEAIQAAHALYYSPVSTLSDKLTEAKLQQGIGDVARLRFIEFVDAYPQRTPADSRLSSLAERAYRKAIRLYHEMAAPLGEALSYYKLGELFVYSSTPGEAQMCFQQAVSIFSKCSNNALGLSKSLLALEKLRLMRGEFTDGMIERITDLRHTMRESCKSKYWDAEAMLVLAAWNVKCQRKDVAQPLISESNQIFRQLGRSDKLDIGCRILSGRYSKWEAFRE